MAQPSTVFKNVLHWIDPVRAKKLVVPPVTVIVHIFVADRLSA
jgi:hypothetical protein